MRSSVTRIIVLKGLESRARVCPGQRRWRTCARATVRRVDQHQKYRCPSRRHRARRGVGSKAQRASAQSASSAARCARGRLRRDRAGRGALIERAQEGERVEARAFQPRAQNGRRRHAARAPTAFQSRRDPDEP